MRKRLIVANWKMNLNVHQASLYVHTLAQQIKVHNDVEVVLAPTMLALQSLSLQVNRRQFKLAAQNIYYRDEGAFTGEVSAPMLRGVADYVIIGHSERRHVFNETDKDIRAKVQAVVRSGLSPILCVGETADERTHNETKHVLHDQLTGGLANIASDEIDKVVIAYEPVWAISNGKDFAHHKIATNSDLEEVAKIIRHQIKALYGEKAESSIRILYGGSVSVDNAQAYLSVKGIDGLLIGGASLHAEQFTQIVDQAHKGKGE